MSRTRLICSAAPLSAYYYMSGAGDPPPADPVTKVTVETPPAPPASEGPTAADHAALKAELESIKESLDAVAEEGKEWARTEIQAALSRLENLEATATEGMKNLAEQVTEIRQRLQDLSTPKSPELPVEPPEPVTDQNPPQVPPAASDHQTLEPEGDGTPRDAPAPSASPSPQRPSKRVI